MNEPQSQIPGTQLHERFRQYTQLFTDCDGNLPPMLQLKVDHTRRVTEDTRQLADRLAWPRENRDLAEIAALFHDIGRFEQYRRFKTFADTRSLDHGDLGVNVIASHNLLQPLTETHCKAVCTAVRWHNKRDVNTDLHEIPRQIVSLVRDADKIDIMRIIGDAIRNGDFAENPEVLLNVDPDGPPTEALLQEIHSGATGSYANVRSLIDMKLVGFAWARDITFAPALELVHDRNLLDGFAAELRTHPRTRDLTRTLENHMARRLNHKTC